MVNTKHTLFKATDRSYSAILKREVHSLAVSGNFSAHKVGEIDIVVSEIVSNLVKHADEGIVLVKLIEEDDKEGIEIISIDEGPGITDVTRMMSDGVSTKNTLGGGLGAMKRLCDVFQIYSQKEWGTIVLARIFKEELSKFKKPPIANIKTLIIPKQGETACGDGFYHTMSDTHIKLFLGDGLGHGSEAAKAVEKAGEAFKSCSETEPVEIIRFINMAVKKTRGLVGTVAVFNVVAKKWQICGVGNIATKVISSAGSKNYMSYNGIIGLNIPHTLTAQELAYEKGQHVIMCSDGLKSRWDILRYPGIRRCDNTMLCASLFKDFTRQTDDASVMVCSLNI